MNIEHANKPPVVIFENIYEWSRLVELLVGEIYPTIVIAKYQRALRFIETINKISETKKFPLAAFVVGGNNQDIELDNKKGETIIRKILEGPYGNLPIFGFAFDYELTGAVHQIQKDPEKLVLLTDWLVSQKAVA